MKPTLIQEQLVPTPQALLARQPIYNSGMAAMSHELLFRHSPTSNAADVTDQRQATLQVLASAMEIGLDRLTAGLPVHVNFPRELLIVESPLPLPPDRVVIEVLENVPGDPEVIAGIAALRVLGHRIALDDYSPDVTSPALLEVADMVKIVITGKTREQLASLAKDLKARGLELIAEEVETLEQFEQCLELGFMGFQGYFLQHPQIFRAKRVPSSRLGMLRLVAALNREGLDSLQEISQLVSQDASMPFRVLRCINSSYYNLPRKVDSIHQAVVILGLDNLRRLCMLVALQAFDDRPSGLFASALVRARMCEQLGRLAGAKDVGPFFITGLFSMLDVITGMPMAELMSELPLAKPVEQALLADEGPLGEALKCTRAYERGAWHVVSFQGLSMHLIRASYLEAVFWADESQSLMAA